MSRAYSPHFPSLHLRHNSFSNPSIALPTSHLILQPFCHFTYVTAHSPTLFSHLLRHKLFTYVIWRAAHAKKNLVAVALELPPRNRTRKVSVSSLDKNEISAKLALGHSSMQEMIQSLGHRKVCSRWVPRSLSEDHKVQRGITTQDLFQRYRNGDDFLWVP